MTATAIIIIIIKREAKEIILKSCTEKNKDST